MPRASASTSTYGFEVAKSFARTYVEFAAPSKHIKLGLYKRRALAKDAGLSADGSGSHRLVIGSDAGPFTDPDGFAWEAPVKRPASEVARDRPAVTVSDPTATPSARMLFSSER